MTNLNAWLPCWTQLRELALVFFLLFIGSEAFGQLSKFTYSEFAKENYSLTYARAGLQPEGSNSVNQTDTVPDPRAVMLRSAMIPGWGQLTNKQGWKVPIVYGMLVGITYYSISLHGDYTDYRAAYYNTHSDDQKFGPTPPTIDTGHSPQALREYRNYYRNRRDFAIIGIFLAYGLNVVDSYVFAHFRDFDVSDDLSANFGILPELAPDSSPFVSVSLRLSFN